MTRRMRIAASTLVVTALFVGVSVVALHSSSTAGTAAGVSGATKIGTMTPTGLAATAADGSNSNASVVSKDLLQPYSMGFVPYAYLPYDTTTTMAAYSAATHAKNFFAAFILGVGCKPLWDGSTSLSLASARSQAILSDIKDVRGKGGDVAVSFGGVNGTELANSCTDVVQLKAAYKSVIDTYGLKHINFDLEGKGLTDAPAMTRRIKAIAGLQKLMPSLKVSLTIPVEETGLDAASLLTVKQFHDNGIMLSSIDIMAMDFGTPTVADSPSHTEASRVISAAQATAKQLQQVYTGLTVAQAYKALGIIVLIGTNDVPGETFTTADARQVHAFVASSGVGTLGVWSANRDMPCEYGATIVPKATCSGIVQSRYQFAGLLSIPAL